MIPGESENSWTGDGTSAYIDWTNAVDRVQGDFTIALLVKTPASSATKRYLVSLADSTGATDRLLFGCFDTTTNWKLNIGGTTADGSVPVVSTLYHVAITVISNAVKVYINGVLDITHGTALGARALTDILALGANWNTGPVTADYWSGGMEKAALYNSGLTAAQVADLFYISQEVTAGGTSLWDQINDDNDSTKMVGTTA